MARMTVETCFFHTAEFEVHDFVLAKAREGDETAKEEVRAAGLKARDQLIGDKVAQSQGMSVHTVQWLDEKGKEVDSHEA